MSNKNPLISIVTVCFNAENLIESTIQSVLEQKFQDIEYIVVDGKSADNTINIIKKYEEKIDSFISEPDTGIYNAMNKGAKRANGEWIIFLNAGDVFVDKDVLQNLSSYLSDKNNDIVYGDILKKDKSGNLFLKKSTAPGNKHKMYFCHQAVFCRTSVCKEMPFDESYELSADFKFFKTAFKQGCNFKQTDIVVTIFDTGGASNKNRLKGIEENIEIIKKTDNFKEKVKLLPRLYFVALRLKFMKKNA